MFSFNSFLADDTLLFKVFIPLFKVFAPSFKVLIPFIICSELLYNVFAPSRRLFAPFCSLVIFSFTVPSDDTLLFKVFIPAFIS